MSEPGEEKLRKFLTDPDPNVSAANGRVKKNPWSYWKQRKERFMLDWSFKFKEINSILRSQKRIDLDFKKILAQKKVVITKRTDKQIKLTMRKPFFCKILKDFFFEDFS